jgi:hypothetical protein
MSKSTPPGPLAVAETDAIAALLADLMPQAAPRQSPPEEPVRAPEPPPLPEIPTAGPPVGHQPLGQFLGQANWRNEPPPPPVPEAPAVPAVGQPLDGPFPAPIGVLGLGEFLGLVNWRNRPDEARALPLLGVPEPPPGSEWSVESVLSQFAWE